MINKIGAPYKLMKGWEYHTKLFLDEQTRFFAIEVVLNLNVDLDKDVDEKYGHRQGKNQEVGQPALRFQMWKKQSAFNSNYLHILYTFWTTNFLSVSNLCRQLQAWCIFPYILQLFSKCCSIKNIIPDIS